MTESRPQAQQQAQATVQQVVDEVAAEQSGQDPDLVRARLIERLAAAGLPEQPQTWLSNTADEIAGDRRLVVDRTVRDEDDPRRQG